MKRGFLGALAAIVLAVIAWTSGGLFGFRWWSWHQELTVTVETPEGIKTASSISAAGWEMEPEWFRLGDTGGGNGVGNLKGEAVVLELAKGRYLFVLLEGYSAELAIKVFAEPPLRKVNRHEYALALDRIDEVTESRSLTVTQYPLLVTFDDISSPATVKRVDPENLAVEFGSGYRLKSITIAITRNSVTKGKVGALLESEFFKKWGDQHHSSLADGGIDNPYFKTLASSLGRGDFIRD